MFLKLISIIILLTSLNAFADEGRNELQKVILKAISNKDLSLLDSCYTWEGVDEIHRDENSFYWEDIFKENKRDGNQVTSVKWVPLEEVDDAIIKEAATKTRSIRGRVYSFNIKILGLMNVEYKDGRIGAHLFAGLDEKGRWKLASTKVSIGTSPDKDNE